MTFSARDFAEDTEFERLVLDRLGTHRVRVAEPGMTYDARTPGGHQIVAVGSIVSGAEAREQLARSLRPVGFGAAYKVLDMLVEHILRANGAPSGHLTFASKQQTVAARPRSLPVPLDTNADVWDRLAQLYVAFAEARHAVTHRRGQAGPAGDLEIYDDARRLSDTITSAEIESFAAAIHGSAELVIAAQDDARRVNIVAWHLNALRPRHQLAALGATDPNAHRRLLEVDLDQLADGRVRFDVARAKAITDGQPQPSVWDLRFYLGDRVFVGRWEEVPDPDAAALEFHPASPPPWLSEEVPAP